MPSFSPYNLSAQFARSAVGRLNRVWSGRVAKPNSNRDRNRSPSPSSPQRQPRDSDVVQNHIESDERPIKQEDDNDSSIAAYHTDSESDEDDMDEESSDDSLPSQQGGGPDHLDGRDDPIQSIEKDDHMSNFGTSPRLRGGSHVQDDDNTAEDGQTNDKEEEEGEDVDDDYDDDEESDLEINMDDYYKSDDDFEDEYDVDSEDMDGYRVERTKVSGIDTWPREVARAHKTIALRGAYSLMPASWAWDLKDHPFVEGLLAPVGSDKRLLFQEQSNRSRVVRALRDLFELHIRICAYRQDGLHDRIADLIEKEIAAYNASIEKDVKLRGFQDYVSPIFILKFSDLRDVSLGDGETLGGWVHDQATEACRTRVEQYRAEWADCEVDSYPRFIYTFVIIQQTVVIWALDTQPGEIPDPYVLASLDMSKRTAWLETSLAIAITIQLAKESLCAYRSSFPQAEQDDDPDA